SRSYETLLVPDNNAELFIPLNEDLELKMIGSVKSIILSKDKGYFFTPRRRGLEILSSSKFIIVKINPIYSRNLCSNLQEMYSGIFEMSLDQSLIRELILACKNDDIYEASDCLSDMIDDEDAYNY